MNPHQSINNKIPNELFFNKSVDISHLTVFACKIFFSNNHKTNKFDNNFKSGIFLVYAPDSLGYKILDISTNSIVTSRDVYFMEDMPETINKTFFCEKYIDSIINFKDFLIEEESINDNNNIHSQLNNPLNIIILIILIILIIIIIIIIIIILIIIIIIIIIYNYLIILYIYLYYLIY